MTRPTPIPHPLTDVERRRFIAKSPVRGPGCWLWIGATNGGGYGSVTLRKSAGLLAHRVAYVMEHGPFDWTLTVDHICRNKACVNPSHLQLVTHSVNAHLAGIWRTDEPFDLRTD